ncbi:hypothetical protein [Aeromonas caviae]|uniref:hypothetical protein n=1 Tax=Aeromonas caviae TaxID=648 RepID=UPI00388FECC8
MAARPGRRYRPTARPLTAARPVDTSAPGTFTTVGETPGFEGTASVTVNEGSYTDLSGNAGTGGSDTAGADIKAPSVIVNIVDDKLTVGETSPVTGLVRKLDRSDRGLTTADGGKT